METGPIEAAGVNGPSRATADGLHRLAVLDVLRILAACAVMLDHLTAKALAGVPSFPELRPVTKDGGLGVLVFFVISGFVIAWSAEGLGARQFAWRRFLRLAPALFVCSLAAFVVKLLAHGGAGPAIADLLRTWVLWPGGPWVDGVYWTLVVEVGFYVLVTAVLATRMSNRLEALAIVWLVAGEACDLVRPSPVLANVPIWPFLPTHYVSYFVLGIFLMLWLRKGATPLRLAVIGACIVGCLYQMYWFVRIRPEFFSPMPGIVWGAAVLVLVLGVRWQQTVWRRPAPGWLTTLGLATYPLYLLHNMCGNAVVFILFRFGANRWLCLAAAIAASIAGSLVVTLMIEPRLRAMLKSLVRRAGRQPASQPA